ncbi:MAG TPA: hypothetical protein VLS27_18230 [Gammaproteobacteria bacterium]|nr:hypothetical protein [Gammaproteobacteria bacterium]
MEQPDKARYPPRTRRMLQHAASGQGVFSFFPESTIRARFLHAERAQEHPIHQQAVTARPDAAAPATIPIYLSAPAMEA